MAPSMYAQPQPSVSPLIAALRGNTPQRQMNPGVMFMQNQQNAPTTPMTSFLRGQQMAQQMAQQAQQQSQVPQQPVQPPSGRGIKGLAGPIPQQSIGAGPKGMAGPVPQQSIAPQRPPLSASGLTFNPQVSSIPAAPPMTFPVVTPTANSKAALSTSPTLALGNSSNGAGMLSAVARVAEENRKNAEQNAANAQIARTPAPAQAPARPVMTAPMAPTQQMYADNQYRGAPIQNIDSGVDYAPPVRPVVPVATPAPILPQSVNPTPLPPVSTIAAAVARQNALRAAPVAQKGSGSAKTARFNIQDLA